MKTITEKKLFEATEVRYCEYGMCAGDGYVLSGDGEVMKCLCNIERQKEREGEMLSDLTN